MYTMMCSAGIGRTGVLITMETAMCQIEANQPVYPLNIVRLMRDQRAMLIQTAVSFYSLAVIYIPMCMLYCVRCCLFYVHSVL